MLTGHFHIYPTEAQLKHVATLKTKIAIDNAFWDIMDAAYDKMNGC